MTVYNGVKKGNLLLRERHLKGIDLEGDNAQLSRAKHNIRGNVVLFPLDDCGR